MNHKGFTLIELLIVVAIIGIIASIAIPNLLIALHKGKQKATMSDLKSVSTALEVYCTDNSMVPNTDLETLNSSTYFTPFYIKILPLMDAWGTEWLYEHPDTISDNYSITSYGRDKSIMSTDTLYLVTSLADFDNNITFSNGQFTVGPIVKK